MSLVRIGDKKVRIGGDGYKPTVEEIREIGIKIGAIKEQPIVKKEPVPEKMTQGIPQSVLDESRAKINQTLLGAANSATMQIPRTVANITAKLAYGKDTPEVIPPGSLGGQLLGAVAPGGVASRVASLATGGIRGATLLPSMAKMAGTGAIESQAIDYKDLKSRAGGAISGALLGGALPVVGKVVGSAWKYGKAVATSGKKLEALESEIKAIKSLPDKGDMNEASKIAFSALDKAEKSMKSTLEASKKQGVQKLTDEFKQNREFINTALGKEAVNQSKLAKGKIRTMLDNMSKTYEAGLDDAEKALASRGETITKNDLYDVITKSVGDAEAYGQAAESGARRVFYEANDMINKLQGDTVTLDNAKSIKNFVFRSMAEGAKKGAKNFDEYDGAKNTFLKNYGELIGKKSPELTELNAEFGPMAQMRSWAIRNFKPFTSDEIPDAANLLRRLSEGKKPNPRDIEYLRQLESGVGRFSGAGNVRGKTTELGEQAKNLSESFSTAKRNLVDSIDFRINQLEESFKPDISTVKKAKYDFGLEFQKRQGQLEALTQKREKLKELKRIRNWAIGLTGVSVLGGGVAGTVLKAKGLHNLDILN